MHIDRSDKSTLQDDKNAGRGDKITGVGDEITPDELLHQAVTDGDLVGVKEAVRLGANVESLGEANSSALIRAAVHRSDHEISKFLISCGAKADIPNEDGATALHGLAHWGWSDLIEASSASGSGLDFVSDEGDSALSLAVSSGHQEAVRALVKKGADPCIDLGEGTTVMNTAPLEVVDIFCEMGASIDGACAKGITALIRSAFLGDADKCAGLIDRGANIDHQAENGATALVFAVLGRQAQSMAVLLEADADPTIRTREDNCVADLLARPGVPETMQLIYQAWQARTAMRVAAARAAP